MRLNPRSRNEERLERMHPDELPRRLQSSNPSEERTEEPFREQKNAFSLTDFGMTKDLEKNVNTGMKETKPNGAPVDRESIHSRTALTGPSAVERLHLVRKAAGKDIDREGTKPGVETVELADSQLVVPQVEVLADGITDLNLSRFPRKPENGEVKLEDPNQLPDPDRRPCDSLIVHAAEGDDGDGSLVVETPMNSLTIEVPDHEPADPSRNLEALEKYSTSLSPLQ